MDMDNNEKDSFSLAVLRNLRAVVSIFRCYNYSTLWFPKLPFSAIATQRISKNRQLYKRGAMSIHFFNILFSLYHLSWSHSRDTE